MDKITIRSSYAQAGLYARSAAGDSKPSTETPKPSAAPAAAGGGARSADGDTFTLSVHARAIRITSTVTVEAREDAGRRSRPGEAERFSAGGRVEALLEFLDRASDRGVPERPGRRRAHFPELGDPEDLAARMLDHWAREHAERGCPRGEFAEELRGRLDRWRTGSASVTRTVSIEVVEFRAEVSLKVSAGIDAWAAAEPEGPAAAA